MEKKTILGQCNRVVHDMLSMCRQRVWFWKYREHCSSFNNDVHSGTNRRHLKMPTYKARGAWEHQRWLVCVHAWMLLMCVRLGDSFLATDACLADSCSWRRLVAAAFCWRWRWRENHHRYHRHHPPPLHHRLCVRRPGRPGVLLLLLLAPPPPPPSRGDRALSLLSTAASSSRRKSNREASRNNRAKSSATRILETSTVSVREREWVIGWLWVSE